jgi:hypothetical protein
MSDNYQVRDGNGVLQTFRSKDIGAGVQLMMSVSADGTGVPYSINNNVPQYVTGFDCVLSSNFSRPADTIAYASGDLVANNTTAGSVTPLSFASAVRASGGVGRIERVRLRKTGTSLTNAAFRIHFFNAAPTGIVNGDNGAWLTAMAGYVGAADVTCDRAFSDGAEGAGVPLTFCPITYQLNGGTTLYALIEARGAYTPVSGETFTVLVENFRF